MYYVRATRDNRYAGGTDRWLKIRSLRKINKLQYEIGAIINGEKKFTFVNPQHRIDHLEFAKGWPGLMPVGFFNVIEGWEEK